MRTKRTTQTIRTTTQKALILVEDARFFILKTQSYFEGKKLRPTPKDKKIRILKRLFSGETYPSAAQNENRSSSTIKKIFDEFVGYAESSSLEEATENYSVQEEIEILREISCDARKAGSSFPELLTGARLLLLLKKLGLSPVHLEDIIKALDKHKDKFGDFVQPALNLAILEEETGKKYNDVIIEYKNTKKKNSDLIEKMEQIKDEFAEENKAAKTKIRSLHTEIQSLDNEIQTRESQLIQLGKRAQNAQKVLDEFDSTKTELHSYGVGYGDFTTVKNLLTNIQKLEGNAAKVVQKIEECGSLENKLSELKVKIKKSQHQQSVEQLTHKIIIKKLETTKHDLENRIIGDESRIGALSTEKIGLMDEISKLKEKRKQMTCQVDGLQKMLAERLGVQADIDVIYETIPVRKKELKELQENIETKRLILSVVVAFENLIRKNPADRKALIKLLELGGVSKEFGAFDRLARQTVTEILAKDGYVPKFDLKFAIIKSKREIDSAKEESERWKRIAQQRLREREKCEKFLQEAYEAIDKEKYAKLEKSISSFFVTLSSKHGN
jgi:DNA repair exonuclease SbcCD ATPase subunit